MKAQAMGAIPVTSRHPNSSMPEVCGLYDMGPPVPAGAVAIQSDPSWFGRWTRALIDAASTPPEELAERRAAMIGWARDTFDWHTVTMT